MNEVSKPRFLITGIVGTGGAAEHVGGVSNQAGTTMAHNLWCSKCTSIVVVPTADLLLDVPSQVAPQKYVVAVDGSGRSHNAFMDACDLCDKSVDTIVVVHVLMNQRKGDDRENLAAAAIEQLYCKLLGRLGMPGRVSFQCVEAEQVKTRQSELDQPQQANDEVSEYIAMFAQEEMATFLAVGLDGAGVWSDPSLNWKAQQRPTPGRVVRYLSLLQNAPCSLIVNCT